MTMTLQVHRIVEVRTQGLITATQVYLLDVSSLPTVERRVTVLNER